MLMFLSVGAGAGDLTGTWRGTVTGASGQTGQAQVTFSDADYLIFSYADSRGQTRSVELNEVGQQIQYVPRGGGVKTHTLQSVSRDPGKLSFVLGTTFERSRNGYLQQDSILESYDFVLGSEGLNMQLVSQSANRLGDTYQSFGGGSQNISAGVLQKVSE